MFAVKQVPRTRKKLVKRIVCGRKLDAFVLRYWYIYIGVPLRNPREGRLRRGGRWRPGNPNNLVPLPGGTPNGPGQASRRRWSRTHVPIIQHIF
jgi:hypothetical protein